MEFEKQPNELKVTESSLVYLVQGKEPYLQELARKVFWTPLSLPKIKI